MAADPDLQRVEPEEPGGAGVDEVADERPELVEGRPAAGGVLLEGERELTPFLELAAEEDERAEAEPMRARATTCSRAARRARPEQS